MFCDISFRSPLKRYTYILNPILFDTLQVMPDQSVINAEDDTAPMITYMDNFNETYQQAKAGGDPMLPCQIAGSTFVQFYKANVSACT